MIEEDNLFVNLCIITLGNSVTNSHRVNLAGTFLQCITIHLAGVKKCWYITNAKWLMMHQTSVDFSNIAIERVVVLSVCFIYDLTFDS